MLEPIEDAYFNWLCTKATDRTGNGYVALLVIMHRTEFVWTVPADRHRADDGVELRLDFLRETKYSSDDFWESQPCSVLEMFLAFANRASFQTDIPTRIWFMEILTNLRLNEFRRVTGSDTRVIQDILDALIWRQYDPNGDGGMFPLSRTNNDQRKIEIWYQFCEYVEDRGIL